MDKKTLQKKIESGDTVWAIKFGFYEVLELKLSSEFKVDDYGNLVHLIHDFDGYNSCIGTYKEIYHAYDTKEEAEWELEFGNVTRTEKLELPTWEQFRRHQEKSFLTPVGDMVDLINLKGKDRRTIIVSSRMIYKRYKTYDRENYLEACRLCKKLFLGEEL